MFKKNLVKLTACVLATVSLGALASCDNEKVEAVNTTPITVWATAKEEAVMSKIINEWNAEHDDVNDFNVKFVAVAEGDAGPTLSKDPTVDGAPALILCADDHIADLAAKDIIAEITGKRAERIQENNSEVAVAGSSYNGKLYGFPVTSDNGYFLWYNNSLVSGKTIESLEDLLAHAESNGKQVLMDVPNGWYVNSFLMSPDACGTSSLFWETKNGKNVYTSNWDSEVGVKVSSYIGDLLSKYYAKGVLVTGSNPEIVAGFASGKMIAAVSGTWMEGDLEKAIGADKLGADKLPSYHIDGKAYQMASFTGSKIFAINKTRPAQEQITAAALAELLTTSQSQLTRFEIRQALPCNKKAAEDKRYTEHVSKGAAALNKQNQYACVQAKTAEAAYWDIGAAIGKAYLDPTNLGGETWAEFLKGQMNILRNPA